MVDRNVVGVVGAGQLARMMQQPAIALDVRIRLLAEDASAAAAKVIVDSTVGTPRDRDLLLQWAQRCTVVTFDHEHVPTEHIRALEAAGHLCRPGSAALVHAQDKAVMRERMQRLGVAQPRWSRVSTGDEVTEFAEAGKGFPIVLKAARGGYDGKGVWFAESAADAAAVVNAMPDEVELLAEEHVDFVRELAALVVRSPSGQQAAYPVVQSVQRDGICVEVVAPAPEITAELAVQTEQTAMRIAAELEVTGVLAVELFETADGQVLVNELAMRPHNTGHWTIDGAVTSQFENHLRAVLDLPLGSPAPRSRWAVMANILGGAPQLFDGYPHVFARDPALKVHLYGKGVRPGRKVGHVTAYGDDLDTVVERARHAAAWFRGDGG